MLRDGIIDTLLSQWLPDCEQAVMPEGSLLELTERDRAFAADG